MAGERMVIAMLLDESGSMQNKVSDVIGGFNAFIESQKLLPGAENVRVFLTRFSNSPTTVFDGVPLSSVPPLTKELYVPSGYTALYDSFVALAERIMKEQQSKAPCNCAVCAHIRETLELPLNAGSGPQNVVFVVITDGIENCSKKHGQADVRKIIEEQQQKGWDIIYIGEHADKWCAGTGTPRGNADNIRNYGSMRAVFDGVSDGVSRSRQKQKDARLALLEAKRA